MEAGKRKSGFQEEVEKSEKDAHQVRLDQNRYGDVHRRLRCMRAVRVGMTEKGLQQGPALCPFPLTIVKDSLTDEFRQESPC